MHYCGVIIKPKGLSIEGARTIAGDYLVESLVADWYSIDEYRERLFSQKRRVVGVKEFLETEFEDFEKSEPVEFIFIKNYQGENYISESYSGEDFYCLIDEYSPEVEKIKEEVEELQKSYNTLYYKKIKSVLERLSEEYAEYDVTMIDYHN